MPGANRPPGSGLIAAFLLMIPVWLAVLLLLPGCMGVTKDGRPTITPAEGYTLLIRETGITGGYSPKSARGVSGITVKWGK